MNAEQFGKLMDEFHADAVNVVADRFHSRDIAEEAVQNAAVYVLENIGRFKRLTKSYFIQLAMSRAKNEKRGAGRREQRLMSAGGAPELAVIEEEQYEKELGRKVALPRAE
jgi:DNA-directed RNA polymerase specialized sigma24 family protein